MSGIGEKLLKNLEKLTAQLHRENGDYTLAFVSNSRKSYCSLAQPFHKPDIRLSEEEKTEIAREKFLLFQDIVVHAALRLVDSPVDEAFRELLVNSYEFIFQEKHDGFNFDKNAQV